MKTISRITAALLVIVMLAAVFTACGKSDLKDERIYGTWKQTDKVDGNWTWEFKEDGTCTLTGETTGFSGKGTYKIEGKELGKIRINLDGWEKEKVFTYAVTDKVLDLEEAFSSYYLIKQ